MICKRLCFPAILLHHFIFSFIENDPRSFVPGPTRGLKNKGVWSPHEKSELFSNDVLVSETKAVVKEELRLGLEVLRHLQEIDSRKLFLDRGHSSLFAFCVRELGYSEPQAQLRIDAMRALRDTPEIEEKVKSGELNVTAVAKVQRFLRKERQRTGTSYSMESRKDLFEKVQGKSLREVEQELIKLSPESALPKERERVVSPDQTELRLVIPEALRLQLQELKALYSHRMKDPSSTVELLELLAGDALKKKSVKTADASRKPDKNVAPISIPVKITRTRTRAIPAALRREIWNRDQGRCTYEDPKTGQRCESRQFVQIDHVQPYSLGGSSTDSKNLRLYCGAHNRLAWDKVHMG